MDFSEIPDPPAGVPSSGLGGTQRGQEHASVHGHREGLRNTFDASAVGYGTQHSSDAQFQFDHPDPLAAPVPNPGMDQYWVFIGNGVSGGDYGRRNWETAIKEGYTPRLAATVEQTIPFPFDRQQAEPHRQSNTGEYITSAGHILMERPEHVSRARAAHFQELSRRLVAGLEVNLQRETREAHGGPGVQRELSVKTTTGDGSTPPGARRPPVG